MVQLPPGQVFFASCDKLTSSLWSFGRQGQDLGLLRPHVSSRAVAAPREKVLCWKQPLEKHLVQLAAGQPRKQISKSTTMTSRLSMHSQHFGKSQPCPRYDRRLPSHIIFFWPQNGFHHHKCIPKWFSWHPARCSLVRWKDDFMPIWNARIRSCPPLAPREGILASSSPMCPPGLLLHHKESFVL